MSKIIPEEYEYSLGRGSISYEEALRALEELDIILWIYKKGKLVGTLTDMTYSFASFCLNIELTDERLEKNIYSNDPIKVLKKAIGFIQKYEN